MSVDWRSRDLPVTPDTVTVLGSRVKADCPMWRGLDWSDVILRERNTLEMALLGPKASEDHHLDIAWAHPADGKRACAGCRYRVRPRRKGWRFVQQGDEWRLQR
jgi:hypothetical protein